MPPSAKLRHPAIEISTPDSGRREAQALYDPGELDEDVEIDLPRKRKILDFYYRLDTATHYELLGVAEDADKKIIRDAYFAEVGTFHPDKYFGKKLGAFKTKLERVFQRMTEAEEVLSRKQTRAEYDAYLRSVRQTRHLEEAMDDESAREAELAEARQRIENEARLAERVSQTPAAYSQPPPIDPEERKRALARKLRGSMAPPVRDSRPTMDKATVQGHVAEELKRRYESRLLKARENQAQRYVESAEQSLASKDLISAANALRIALSLAPDDSALRQRFEEVQQKATASLADTYLEQARYEESNRHWADAAASYEKAARGKPSAQLYGRAAACLYEGQADLKKAVELARKAVSLAPKAAELRVTLGKIYGKAGMKESALAELERASQLAPEDDTIKDWLKRIKRGEV